MIRKMLVIAAAVAMPAASIAGISAVAGSGIASAKGLPITAGVHTCDLTGSVTFAKPGLSHGGSVTNKLSVIAKSAVTPSGECGTKAIKNNILTTTTQCGVTPLTDAPACTDPLNAKNISKGKDRYFNTTSSLATGGVDSLVSSFSATGIKSVLLGNNVLLTVGNTGGNTVASIVGGVCGVGNTGFGLAGSTDVAGLTYVLNLCIVGDTGVATTGGFFADFLTSASGANNAMHISTGVFASPSQLIFTQA